MIPFPTLNTVRHIGDLFDELAEMQEIAEDKASEPGPMTSKRPVVTVDDIRPTEEKQARRPSVDESPGHDAPKSVSCVQKRRSSKRVSRLSCMVHIK